MAQRTANMGPKKSYSASNPSGSTITSSGSRNAAVDQAAANKSTYTQDDIRTYGNKETAFNFNINGKPVTIHSNYTHYDDPDFLKELGLDKADEGEKWNLNTSVTYPVAGGTGNGTTYNGTTYGGQAYASHTPASGGFYGAAMSRVNDAHNTYGGLDNVVANNKENYEEYMKGNYLPIYGKDESEINWDDVASGKAAEEYHAEQDAAARKTGDTSYWKPQTTAAQTQTATPAQAQAPADMTYNNQAPAPSVQTSISAQAPAAETPAQTPAPARTVQPAQTSAQVHQIEGGKQSQVPAPAPAQTQAPAQTAAPAQTQQTQQTQAVNDLINYWDNYLKTMTEGIANSYAGLAYQDPLQQQAQQAQTAQAINYAPINAAQWNYDVPETILMSNPYGLDGGSYTNYGQPSYNPASSAYGGLLASGVSADDLKMAQYWSEIAAAAKSWSDREYALRQALNYRSRITG